MKIYFFQVDEFKSVNKFRYVPFILWLILVQTNSGERKKQLLKWFKDTMCFCSRLKIKCYLFKWYFCFFMVRIFNTNNLWMKLAAIKRLVEEDKMHMEVIINNKVQIYLDMIQLFKLACLVGFKTWKSIICEDLAVFANALVIFKKRISTLPTISAAPCSK